MEIIKVLESDERIAIEFKNKILDVRCHEDARSDNSEFYFNKKVFDDFDSFNHLADQIAFYLFKDKKLDAKRENIYLSDKELDSKAKKYGFI